MLNINLCKAIKDEYSTTTGKVVVEKTFTLGNIITQLIDFTFKMEVNDVIELEAVDSLEMRNVLDILYVLNKLVPTNEISYDKVTGIFEFIKTYELPTFTDRNIALIKLYDVLSNDKVLSPNNLEIIRTYYNNDIELFKSFYKEKIENDLDTLLTKYVYHRDELNEAKITL